MATISNNTVTDFNFFNYFQVAKLGFSLRPYEGGVEDVTPMPYMDMRFASGWQNRPAFSGSTIEDVGDYNGDGLDDLFVKDQFVNIAPKVLLSNGDGTFREAALLGDAVRETVGEAFSADFNGDGLLDIYSSINGNFADWPGYPEYNYGATGGDLLLLNIGNSQFAAQKVMSTIEHQFGVDAGYQEAGTYGDIDNDGDIDVISIEMGNWSGPNFDLTVDKRVLINDGQGNFSFSSTALPIIETSTNTHSARLADLDNDGIVDIVIPSRSFGTESDFLRSGAGTQILFNNGNDRFDDDLEYVITDHWAIGKTDYLRSQFPDVDYDMFGYNPSFVNFFDVNDDGYLDILCGQKVDGDGISGTAGGFELYINNGDRTFTDSTTEYFPNLTRNYNLTGDITPDITRFNFADIDGDGDNDFVMEQGLNLMFASPEDGYSTVYPYIMINEGGKFYPLSASSATGLFIPGELVAYGNMITGDFNGDGVIDIVSMGGVGSDGKLTYQTEAPYNGIWTFFGKTGSDTLTSTVRGTGRDDTLVSATGITKYIPGKGNDSIVGGAEIETAIYWDDSSHFTLNQILLDQYSVVSDEGTDRLTNIERLQFTDKFIAIDLYGHAGQTAKLLGALFGADSVTNKEYAGIGLSLLDGGMSYEALAGLAISVTDAGSHTEICALLWENVVGTPADPGDIAPFVQMLDEETMTVAQLVVLAADTALNVQNIDLAGLATAGLEYTPLG